MVVHKQVEIIYILLKSYVDDDVYLNSARNLKSVNSKMVMTISSIITENSNNIAIEC